MRAESRKLMLLIAAVLAVLAGLFLLERRGGPTPAAAPEPSAQTAAATPTPDSPLRGKLRIDEIMVKNAAALPDEDGDFPDWIELYNASDESLDLEGWRLADREDREGWAFPRIRLPGGGRLLVFASGKDRADEVPHTDFSLSKNDVLSLYDREGALVDRVVCRGAETDVSLVRGEDGAWAESLYPTPGQENTPEGYELWQQTLLPAGPLVISEAMVANFGVYSNGIDDDPDWVEIKNISDEPVQLENYWLSDKVGERLLWNFPEGKLRPGASILVLCREETDGHFGSTPCTGFALDSVHEQLYLSDSEGTLLDCASLRDIPYNCSYGRIDGEPGFFYFSKATPGQANRGGWRRVGSTPLSPAAGGVFDEDERPLVELSGRGTLRYTLDGSAPTEESPEYSGPVEITKSCVLRARSFEDGALPSRCLTLSFILDKPHDLPVVSLVADAPKSFRSMYDAGSKGYEHPGAISFFPAEGEGFTIPCGISINGETSRVLTKKNMAIRFRGAYGQDTLSYDLFGGGVTQFSSLLLRAGQDQYDTVLRNELCLRLAQEADTAVISQRSRYCALYINGEYAGLYALMERCNAAHYAALAGVSRGSAKAYEAPLHLKSDCYREVVEFANHNDMSLDENYAQFCSVMDADSLIDWLILEGYCANTDLTSGNLRYVRSDEADGKWHLMLYDMDATFRSRYSIFSNVLSDWAAGRIQVCGFVRSLMANAQFRDRFLTRAAGYLSGPLSNENLLAVLDDMADEIRPELQRDFARYGKDPRTWESNLRNLRAMLVETNWRQANIDALCEAFDLGPEERAAYFGAIDDKH